MGCAIFPTNTAVYCVVMWITMSLGSSSKDPSYQNKTVRFGVIVDRHDERAAAGINRTVEIGMNISNSSKFLKMNTLIQETDLNDTFMLRQTICRLIEKQPMALFVTSKSETFNIVESYSRSLKIPFFLPSMTRDSMRDGESYIIRMCPSFIDAVIDIIKHLGWDRIFYLFDTDDALWRVQRLYQVFYNRTSSSGRKLKEVLIVAIRVPDVNNCREILRRIDRNYNSDQRRFVIDLYSTQDYDKFMSQIIDVGMNRDGYHYILGTLDINAMNKELWRSFTFGGVNITGFQFIDWERGNQRHQQMRTWLNSEHPPLESALTIDTVAVLTTAYVKMVYDSSDKISRRGRIQPDAKCSQEPVKSSEVGQIIIDHLRNVTIDGLSGRVAFDEQGYRTGYTLELFHLSYRSPLQKVGIWTHGKPHGTLSTKLRNPVHQDPPLIKNRTRVITTIMNEPFIQLKTHDNGSPLIGNERYEGFLVDMFKSIANLTGIQYAIKEVGDKAYGDKMKDGTWNGMIKELLDGTADIALASLTINHKRESVVAFTKPFMNTGISIMIKKPEKDKPGVFSFMEPLSYKVWGCIMAGFLSVSFILYMVGRFSPYEWQKEGGVAAPSDTFSFVNTLWFSLGALMQQGPDIFPRSLSGRVLGSAWWFFTLIMISSYTANLAAFLTFEKLTTPISSVDDLVKQSTIKYGIQRNGSTQQFFEESKVNVYETMNLVMKNTVPDVYVSNSKEGWQRVVNGKGRYAFLLESSNNNYYNQRRPCKTMKVGHNLDQKGYGLATRKDSDLRHILNIKVLELRENGDLMKLEQKWWYSKGQCGSADGADKGKNALNLSNVSGIFHILIGGLVLAMMISLSQIVFHAKIRPRYTKQETYNINGPERVYKSPKRVTIEDPPAITCTTSNGREPHLITFEDLSDLDIISLDHEKT